MARRWMERTQEAAAVPEAAGASMGLWAQLARTEPACQCAVDAKAFKGKGTRMELRHWVDRLVALEREMVELSQASKSAGHTCGAYLAIHRRSATGYVHLRWREHGRRKRHLQIEQVHAMVKTQAASVQAWVHEFHDLAQRLNAGHKKVRSSLRELRAQSVTRPSPMLPRSIA